MRNPVSWFEIYVQDMSRAKQFYETVLETELKPMGPAEINMYGFASNMDIYGASGALVYMPGFPSGGNSTLVYFNVDDCATNAARVEKAGGKIQRDKMSIGEYGFIVLAVDTEGNMFGLHSLS
ncbi:MAG: VOC family protein [Paraglaciecola sp.]|nr:VOC family protein [Paraglaciecola sp.]MDP5030037.1 VOC family protein [Paraglaciecola sp.]MDP5130883.1 VOC family protein [Paraglaciecola sp.]